MFGTSRSAPDFVGSARTGVLELAWAVLNIPLRSCIFKGRRAAGIRMADQGRRMRRSASLMAVLACSFALVGCAANARHGRSLPQLPLVEHGASVILGPARGVGTRTFSISPRPRLYYFLGCSGPHLVWVRTSEGAFAVSCKGGGVVGGESFSLARSGRSKAVWVRVIAPRTVCWELRVDWLKTSSL